MPQDQLYASTSHTTQTILTEEFCVRLMMAISRAMNDKNEGVGVKQMAVGLAIAWLGWPHGITPTAGFGQFSCQNSLFCSKFQFN